VKRKWRYMFGLIHFRLVWLNPRAMHRGCKGWPNFTDMPHFFLPHIGNSKATLFTDIGSPIPSKLFTKFWSTFFTDAMGCIFHRWLNNPFGTVSKLQRSLLYAIIAVNSFTCTTHTTVNVVRF
jgi:hypothetical protein